jgi:WD40 repeat protein
VSGENQLGRRTDPRSIVSIDVKLPEEKRPHGITCIALSPSGNRLAVCSLDNHIYEYNFYAPEEPQALYNAPIVSFYARTAYSPSGLHLVSGSSTVNANIFDTSLRSPNGVPVDPVQKLEGHSQSVFAVDWSPFNNEIATCSDDGTTRLWTFQANRPQIKRRKMEENPEEEEPAPAPRTRQQPVQSTINAFFRPV